MSKGIKTILGIVVLVAIAGGAYFFLSSDKQVESGLVSGNTALPVASTVGTSPSGVSVGQEFVALLLNLQAINLDTALFQDPAYLSLKEKTVNFQDPGGQGRPNPFAPIGSDVIPPSVDEAAADEELGLGGDTTPEGDA